MRNDTADIRQRPFLAKSPKAAGGFTLIEPFDSPRGLARGKPPVVRQGKRGAFTLIELLVVIAIISLLMSMLVPSLRQARRLAMNAACMSNLKNFSNVELIYATDSDGYFPGWSWIDADGVEQNTENCYVPDPDGPGGYLSIGRHSDGQYMRVMASHQNLFMRLDLIPGYVWCTDFENQAALEANMPAYKWQARPNYNIAWYMQAHFNCTKYDSPVSSGNLAARTAVNPTPDSGYCPHLIRTDMVDSQNIMLGERYYQRNNWSVGYGYPNDNTMCEYGGYQASLRHPGPRGNFAWMDGSVHSWDLATWLDNIQWARDLRFAP